MYFRNRQDAGERLGTALQFLKGEKDLVVLGIPRGGVVVAYEIARIFEAPINVWIARKIGAPGNPEYAIGAVACGGSVVLDNAGVEMLNISRDYTDHEIERLHREIEAQMKQYRGEAPFPSLHGKVALLVDDGVATGSTVMASLRALRSHQPTQTILGVPVGPPDTIHRLSLEADRVVVIETPSDFVAVGRYYERFEQVSDGDVISLLARAQFFANT